METTKNWKKVLIAVFAAILLVMTPMAITAQASSSSEYYNPYFNASGSGVQIIPYHVWYGDGKMYADSYVVNCTNNNVKNINVSRLRIYTSNGTKIADASFGKIKNMSLAPGRYGKHRFTFSNGKFKKANLSNGIRYNASTSWTNY